MTGSLELAPGSAVATHENAPPVDTAGRTDTVRGVARFERRVACISKIDCRFREGADSTLSTWADLPDEVGRRRDAVAIKSASDLRV